MSVVVGGRDSLDSKLRSSPTLAVIVLFVTAILVPSSCALRRSHDIPLACYVDLMGAVVCGGWKGHSHTWEVVGIVASWGM